MSPDLAATDPRCGTTAGYQAHVKDRTPRCRPCLDAQAQWARRYRARKYWAKGLLLIDATGTHRRLQALAAVGWSFTIIAEQLGVSRTAVQQWNVNATVYRKTAARVAELYEQLSEKPGPSSKTAARARAAGWPPPIAWDPDTIDDPAATACLSSRPAPDLVDEVAVHRAIRGDRAVDLTRAERIEAVRLLTARGCTAQEIAERLGKHRRQVNRDRAAAQEATA